MKPTLQQQPIRKGRVTVRRSDPRVTGRGAWMVYVHNGLNLMPAMHYPTHAMAVRRAAWEGRKLTRTLAHVYEQTGIRLWEDRL